MKPFIPMSPVYSDIIPEGKDWVYQLKWDGYRIIASARSGHVGLYSKKMLEQNSEYPELVQALSKLEGEFILDGEVIVMDAEIMRPSFQKLQQRGKLTEREPVQYMLFDLLNMDGNDLRKLPYRERHALLKRLASAWGPPFFVADVYEDGRALWEWVQINGWEGVISKRLGSLYKEGKEHKDWYKRKAALRLEPEAVGILFNEGRAASLVMRMDGAYIGRVSSGLNTREKAELLKLDMSASMKLYFDSLPAGLKGETVRWLAEPLSIEVTGAERTEGGLIRHPKLLSIGGRTL
ncbi:DNA ligase [Paenibacillus sp. sptzw28]|uniref:ATP-dependent DNA ligase n=1 Tax=Paenibacillus sp. sptzw28 TaxID=715179 RepID=UPI001C6E9DEF|nr:DNA ligase [Paenibacillus sp. sptzw28]QYR19108.1 DNA ligase [Paenibacillus sp. sptzw28]